MNTLMMQDLVAAVDIPDDGMVVIRRAKHGSGYRVSVLYGGRQLRSTLVATAEELGGLLDRSMPGTMTLRRCMNCGEVYGAYAGGEPGMLFSHGYCSEACAGLLPDEPA